MQFLDKSHPFLIICSCSSDSSSALFVVTPDRFFCVLWHKPWSLHTGVLNFHRAAGRHESAPESEGKEAKTQFFESSVRHLCSFILRGYGCISCSESGPLGSALLHHPAGETPGWAAESPRLSGGVPLSNAVGRVCQRLASSEQLHGLHPQG